MLEKRILYLCIISNLALYDTFNKTFSGTQLRGVFKELQNFEIIDCFFFLALN